VVGHKTMQTRHWTWLKWASLSLSLGSVLLAAVFMWGHDKQTAVPEANTTSDSPSSTNVESPLIVERQGEHLIWRLKAKSAKQQGQVMLLATPILELFTANNELVLIEGEKAWFEPLRRNIHFSGNVQVQYRDWHLSSDTLRYDSSRDEVIVPHAFEVLGTDTKLKGRGLRVDRKTQQLYVAHDVWLQDARVHRLGGLP